MQNEVLSLDDLFTKRVFHIPSYQRGYAWEKPQLEDFIEDLEYLPEGKKHFTGTIILHKSDTTTEDEEGVEYTHYDVVDGQQRLTTSVILLSAIEKAMSKLDATKAQGIRKRFLEFKTSADDCQKLNPGDDSAQYFTEEVIKDDGGAIAGEATRAHDCIKRAKEFFRTHLEERKKELRKGFADWLNNLHRKLTQKLQFLLYVVADQADVGVIFEVTNDRGKPLSELEKVKNYLLYVAVKLSGNNDSLKKAINDTWAVIFQRLRTYGLGDRTYEDRLLRAHWLTVYQHDSKKWHGCKTVKERFSIRIPENKHRELRAAVDSYVATLKKALVVFCDCYNPEHSDAFNGYAATDRKNAVKWGAKLHRVGNIVPYLPLLLATRMKHPRAGGNYVKLLDLCEKVAFRVHRWAERRSNAGQPTYFRLGYALYHGKKTFTQVLKEFAGQSCKYCPDSDFTKKTEYDGGSWYEWSGLKYFLYEFEENLAGARGPKVKWEQIGKAELKDTIEHVLPQTPTHDYWLSRFPDETERKQLTHDVGNLTLTYDNSSYGNKPFPRKRGDKDCDRACYTQSTLFIEKELAKQSDWTKETIMTRRERIMKWAEDRWALPVAATPPTDPEEEDEDVDDEEDDG